MLGVKELAPLFAGVVYFQLNELRKPVKAFSTVLEAHDRSLQESGCGNKYGLSDEGINIEMVGGDDKHQDLSLHVEP